MSTDIQNPEAALTQEQRMRVAELVSEEGWDKALAIAEVTGTPYSPEVEIIDARPQKEVPPELKEKCIEAGLIAEDEPVQTVTIIEQPKAVAMPVNQEPQLTVAEIKKYICPSATDQEAYTFMKLCAARGLNPFVKEAYLLKYGGQAATMVVGKDAFTRRAEDHPQFDGFEAGVIVQAPDDSIDYRDGTFMLKNEELLGGWAKVHRKDRSVAFKIDVSMSEYSTGKSSWQKMPATMIRKVALVQALREAFPSDLGGCYDSSEMGAEI